MFIKKKNYYFYIDNTKSINLNLIKKNINVTIIYRNSSRAENINQIIKFRKKLKVRRFNFYIANNLKIAKKCKADGLYISAYNKNFYKNIKVIGSAHNFKEINQKIKQGCKSIFLSRLFKTSYLGKESFYGPIKFNLISQKYPINLIPLGGINNKNLLKLNLLSSSAFSCLSEIKKKPAISNRLF
jgi:thiamine-phosphate pyrophosphorylase